MNKRQRKKRDKLYCPMCGKPYLLTLILRFEGNDKLNDGYHCKCWKKEVVI